MKATRASPTSRHATCEIFVSPRRRQNAHLMVESLNQYRAARFAPPQPIFGAMPNFFLRTKLLPPRLSPERLARPRLIEKLKSNLARPCALITANAGYGKTTLVAEFVRKQGQKFVWYQIDRTDADPFVFLGYIAHGIKQVAPQFGDAVFTYLQQSAPEIARQPERAVDVLLNEVLDKIEQQLILVLDDYHNLGAETAVHAVVDRLLEYLPDVLHVIILSRDVPPLALARLRSKDSLATIDQAELAFTDAETQELFRQTFDLELTPAQLAEYRERTHGWITALQLVRQVAYRQAFAARDEDGEKNSNAPNLIEILRQSESDIFDYFAQEVFENEPENVRELLPRLALLDRIEIETCSRLFPAARCSSLLPKLVRRNVFVSLVGDRRGEEYRFHPLFKDFLRRRLRAEIGAAQVYAEHARFADYFIACGAHEQAMRHLLAAEDYTRAAHLLAEKGDEWLANNAFESLVALVGALPKSALEAHPRIFAYRAEVARLRGEYQEAIALLTRAIKLFHERSAHEDEAEALHSLATIARRHADYETAFAHLNRAVELSDENSAVRIKCGNTRGLCLTSLGEWTRAEEELRAALEAAEAQHNEKYIRLITHNLGLPAMMQGRFGEALNWFRRMLRESRTPSSHNASTQTPAMPQEATAHLNMARCHLYRGELAECEKNLESALACCQAFNLVALFGEVFETYGSFYREQDDIAHASEYFDRAARSYADVGTDLTRTELNEERALLDLQTGELARARTQLNRLVEARTAARNKIGLRTAMLTRGRIALAQNDYEAARRDIEPALVYFRAHDLFYYQAQAHLALAVCEFAARDENALLEHLSCALELAARYDYDHLLKREMARFPQMFNAPAARAKLPPSLVEHLSNLSGSAPRQATAANSLKSAAPIQIISQPVTDLTINLLGAIEIYRDLARPLSAYAWTTRRARDILCFIASRPARRVPKDTLIDVFWGEADFDVIEKNFHPTISHIRKALNSNQTFKQNFLLYRGGEYLLNPELSYRIDIEEFDNLNTAGERARRAGERERFVEYCEQAVELYRGEFMQGSYDDWVIEQRNYYREQFLCLLTNLIKAAQEVNDWSRVLQLTQRVLQEDSFREDIHCIRMRAHAASGNKVAVKEQFETLRRLLRKELDVEPSPATQKVFQELIK
jgi:LuxR family maltose regulon positive regulatory protein